MGRIFIDQMGREVTVPDHPRRIVSLVPSQTELLHDLGLDEEVVGITKFCIHPRSWFETRTRVGGTKNIRLDTLRSLQPDLLLGNKEENNKEDMDRLFAEYPVWMSDVRTLQEALDMIASVGRIVLREKEAAEINRRITAGFEDHAGRLPSNPLRVLYLIWHGPWMGAGDDTFVHDLLTRCGFINVLAGQNRYPELSTDEMVRLDPDIVLLSSEPFPFKASHAEALRIELGDTPVHFVDGEMFSWYGSRLLHAPGYLASLLKQIHAGC